MRAWHTLDGGGLSAARTPTSHALRRCLLARTVVAGSDRSNFYGSSDMVAGARDASGRLAEELARKIVDDVVAGDWKKGEQK